MSEFKGEALPMSEADFERAADRLGCEVAAIKAVAEVESGGRSGFLRNGQPKILFESRWFHKLTDGIYDATHPDISTPTWVRNYAGGAKEYRRLEKAIALDRKAALKSASWGKFQVLGVNHEVAGFRGVEGFVKAQMKSEGKHLDAFVGFVERNRLDDELRDLRWADFARGYNGPGYKKNRYDTKMAAAYKKHSGKESKPPPTTRQIQQALIDHGADIKADGMTGPKTRQAIRDFQWERGLAVDGRVGPLTLSALGLA